MPTVLRVGASRFFFDSNEGSEPPHIHVESGEGFAKFWLEPVSSAFHGRLPGHELRHLERLVSEHRREFLEAWHEFFGT